MKSPAPRAARLLPALAVVLIPWASVAAGANALPPGAEGTLDVAVVTHKDLGIETLTKQELNRLFMSLSSSASGVTLKAVNLKTGDMKMRLLHRLTGMAPRKIDDHFIQLELMGQGRWPPEVETPAELVRLIVEMKNVVGWLPVSALEELTPRQRSMLQVLRVDGLSADGTGYIPCT